MLISAFGSKSRGSTTASLDGSQKIGIEKRDLPERFSTRCGVKTRRPFVQRSSRSPILQTNVLSIGMASIHSSDRLRT